MRRIGHRPPATGHQLLRRTLLRRTLLRRTLPAYRKPVSTSRPSPHTPNPGGIPGGFARPFWRLRQWPSDFTWPATWPCHNYLKSICASSTTAIGLPMSARIHFSPQHLQQLRLWPTDQANPYPYVREKIEESDWKLHRLEKLLPRGHLATWPESQLSQHSFPVSVQKYFSPKHLVCGHLRKLAKYFWTASRLGAIVCAVL